MAKIIEIKDVFKSYDKKKVLEKVSFSLEEGQLVTLIGCNGAGKSTTLRLLAGIEAVDKGQITVLNGDPFSFDFAPRSDIFVIHENIEINSQFNLLDTVKIYRKVFPRWNNRVFNEIQKARKISLKKHFSELSRGQKMQFLLMVGLAANPKIMYLDEITAVIDIEGQRYFLEKLKEYTLNGGTAVITTNILSELNDYTDHLLLLQETKLLVNESVKDLQRKFIILKQSEPHDVFKHHKCAKIRKDHDGINLYIIPREVIDVDTTALKLKVDYIPRLEDILILYFQLKQEQSDDELVA